MIDSQEWILSAAGIDISGRRYRRYLLIESSLHINLSELKTFQHQHDILCSVRTCGRPLKKLLSLGLVEVVRARN